MSTTINKITISKKLTWPIIILTIFIVGFVIVPNVSTPTKQAEASEPSIEEIQKAKAEELKRIEEEAKKLEIQKTIVTKEKEILELKKTIESDPKE